MPEPHLLPLGTFDYAAAGYVLAVLTALFVALTDVLCRALFRLEPTLPALQVAALRYVFALPVFVAFMPSLGPPPVTPVFATAVAVGIPLELLGLALYVLALKTGPLSVGPPLLALTPGLLLIASPLITGDPWSVAGWPGVVALIVGVWLLQADARGKESWVGRVFAPIRALLRQAAARYMLAVALIFTSTAVCLKIAVGEAPKDSPMQAGVYYFASIATGALILVLPQAASLGRLLWRRPALCAAVAVVFGLASYCNITAFSWLPAAEMIALKRLSLLFAPVLGAWWLREAVPPGRSVGIVFMVAGAVWIGLAPTLLR